MIHFTADHAQQALRRANLLLLSSTSQKISSQSSWRRAKRSCRVGDRWRKWFRLGENCLLRSSLHQYINNRHPIAKKDNCLVRRHPPTPASCDTVVWIQPWTRKEKIGWKWVQIWCLAAMFVRTLDKCGHTAHYKELTETGNRASKLSGIQVRDCLTAWSI